MTEWRSETRKGRQLLKGASSAITVSFKCQLGWAKGGPELNVDWITPPALLGLQLVEGRS